MEPCGRPRRNANAPPADSIGSARNLTGSRPPHRIQRCYFLRSIAEPPALAAAGRARSAGTPEPGAYGRHHGWREGRSDQNKPDQVWGRWRYDGLGSREQVQEELAVVLWWLLTAFTGCWPWSCREGASIQALAARLLHRAGPDTFYAA